jgi:hypothetical protein
VVIVRVISTTSFTRECNRQGDSIQNKYSILDCSRFFPLVKTVLPPIITKLKENAALDEKNQSAEPLADRASITTSNEGKRGRATLLISHTKENFSQKELLLAEGNRS